MDILDQISIQLAYPDGLEKFTCPRVALTHLMQAMERLKDAVFENEYKMSRLYEIQHRALELAVSAARLARNAKTNEWDG